MKIATKAPGKARQVLSRRIVFFVGYVIDEVTENRSLGHLPEYSDVFNEFSPRVLEACKRIPEIGALAEDMRGQCIVVCVEAEEFPPDRAIGSWVDVRNALQPLLLNALQGGPESRSSGVVVSASDENGGRLFASVLLEKTLEEAKAHCKKAKNGELKLVGKKGGEPLPEPTAAEAAGLVAIREKIQDIARGLPAAYSERRPTLERLADVVRQELASALEPSLNEHVVTLPQASYEEKKDLAKWINAELRRFGLAIKGPTDHPCSIVATTGNRPSEGRFVLDYTDAEGKRHHPLSSATLPHLELTLDDLTRVPYGQRSAQRHR